MQKRLLLSIFACASLGVIGCGDTGSDATTGLQTTTVTASASGTDTASSTSDSDTATATASAGTDSTSASGTTSGTTTEGSTGSVFIEDPDGGAGSIECDIWAQDCVDGEKCMPWANDGGGAWNATKCSPVDPNPKQPGDPCTVEGNGVSGVDDCDVAAMCWNVDPETNMGSCVDFCQGSEADPSCADPTTNCVIANDGVLILCLPGCDPLVQGCPNMDLCIPQPMGDGFVCVLDASGDMGVAGDPCEYANACDAGLFCANAASVPNCQGSAGCCAPFCDLSDPMCPAEFESGGAMCVPWYEEGMAPPQYMDVGACVIPA